MDGQRFEVAKLALQVLNWSIPVHGHDFRVEGESGRMRLALIPDTSAIGWSVEGVVDSQSENEEPGKECKDSVGQE